jgi:hypothetical protein
MTAGVTSSIALNARRRADSGRARSSARSFSTTTMASSTTMPMASTRPKSERLFSEKPASHIAANVPMSETGMATSGTIAVRHVLQEDEDHERDERDADEERVHHIADALAHEARGVVLAFRNRRPREALFQLLHLRVDRVGGLNRVRARQLEDGDRRPRACRRKSSRCCNPCRGEFRGPHRGNSVTRPSLPTFTTMSSNCAGSVSRPCTFIVY